MNWDALVMYDAKEEEYGGAYWNFLKLSKDDIFENMTIYKAIDVIKMIKSEWLREKMKEKILEVFDFKEINELETCIRSGLFSQEKNEEIIENIIENFTQKSKDESWVQNINETFVNKIISIIALVGDKEYKKEKICFILECICKSSATDEKIKELINGCVYTISDSSIRSEIILEFFDKVSDKMKIYNQICQDKKYILKKAANFRNEKIGIDPNIKIGLEIEINSSEIKAPWLCMQEGMSGAWSAIDITVFDGIEYVTGVFHDTPEELSVICALCDTLKGLGHYYDEEKRNAAGQINIGIDYLDTAESILEFFEIYCNAEELLYYISNKEGQLPRFNIYENRYMKPISGEMHDVKIEKPFSRLEIIRMFTAEGDYHMTEKLDELIGREDIKSLPGLEFKSSSVCLRDGNRLEFRIPNGTVDYKTWIDNIRLYGKIVEVAKEMSDNPDCEKIKLKEEMKDSSKTLEEKLYLLMDLLFDDNEIKKIYMDRFYSVQRAIKEKNVQEYVMPCNTNSKGFSIVEFQKNYRTRVYENRGPIVMHQTQEKMQGKEPKKEI